MRTLHSRARALHAQACLLCALAVLMLVPRSLAAQAAAASKRALPTAAPETVGLSPERLERIDALPLTPTQKVMRGRLRDLLK